MREHILEFFIDTQETMNTTNDQGQRPSTMTSYTHGQVMKQVKGKVKAKKKLTTHLILNNKAKHFVKPTSDKEK